MKTSIEQIKQILEKHVQAEAAINRDWSGRVTNPTQQAVSTRHYNKAHKMAYACGIDSESFINLHREILGLKRIKI